MEHIYTIQQISGGPSYSASTFVGNWVEDREVSRVRKDDFLQRKDAGSLVLHDMQRKMKQHLQPVQLKTLRDGKLRFNDIVQLQCLKTEGVLAGDLGDRQENSFDIKCAVTTTLATAPTARTAFQVVRVPHDGYDPKDDIVHYNQPVRLRACDELVREPHLYLQSQAKSPTNVSKILREQEVTLCNKVDMYISWCFEMLDPNLRPETEGTPVLLDDRIVVRHVATNALLAGSDALYRNDFLHFTKDHEVHVKDYVSTMKFTIGSRDRLPMGPENQWRLIGLNPGESYMQQMMG
eukprot:Rmarinus@m.20426